MPKIKNWSKISNTKWSNTENKDSIVIKRDRTGEGWLVNWRTQGRYRRNIAMTNTKEEARKAAVRWMRDHPLDSKSMDELIEKAKNTDI